MLPSRSVCPLLAGLGHRDDGGDRDDGLEGGEGVEDEARRDSEVSDDKDEGLERSGDGLERRDGRLEELLEVRVVVGLGGGREHEGEEVGAVR